MGIINTMIDAPPNEIADDIAGFENFLSLSRTAAESSGISPETIARSFAGIRPNLRVLELDRKQAETAASSTLIKSDHGCVPLC
jgi:membrane-bound lytic murein transglycosylase B